VYASPTVVGNNLYIGSCAGICYALDKLSGEVLWEYKIGECSFHGDPVVVDSLLIIPTDRDPGTVHAFDLEDGSLVWRFDVEEDSGRVVGVTTDLVTDDGSVFGVTSGDNLICLDIERGDLIWDYRSAELPEGRYWNVVPAMLDTAILFAGFNGRLHCLDATSGAEIWASNFGSPPATSLTLHEGDVLVAGTDSTIYRLSGIDGEIVNSLKLPGRPGLQLNVIDTTIYVFVRNYVGSTGMTGLVALKADLSEIIWELPVSDGYRWTTKRIYGFGESILVGRNDGEVSVVDPRSGKVTETFNVEGEVRSFGFDGDIVFIGTIMGLVHAVKVVR